MTGPAAHIDLSAIVANWRMLARRAAPARAAAVVKADAYGLGAAQAATALAKAGCTRFYVAWPSEGATLRQTLGPGPEIAVFNGLVGRDAGAAKPYLESGLEPVLNSLDQIGAWLELAPSGARSSIHVDTGMNRLGLNEIDWPAAAAIMPTPHRLVSHLACADELGSPMNGVQLEAYHRAAALWPNAVKSLSATAGVYLGPAYVMDEIRPGIGLYGGGPAPATGEAPVPVVRLTAPILQVREIAADANVGYGATWASSRPATLATVGVGYADGFLRAASNRGYAVLKGSRRPIVGRVSMDLIVLDVTGADARVGDEVELLGHLVPISEQAEAMATIDYELLTRLGGRVRRIWTEGA